MAKQLTRKLQARVKRSALALSISPLAVASAGFLVALSGRAAFAQEASTISALPPTDPVSTAPASTTAAPAAPEPASTQPAPSSSRDATSSPPPSVPQRSPSPTPADSKPFEEQTLFGEGRFESGGYGGPLVRFSSFNGQGALFAGGRGGWLINHRLLIGGAGMGQTLSLDAPSESVNRYPRARNIEFGYGGFLVGYHIVPESRVHGFASVLFAGGGLVLSDRDSESDPDVGHDGDGVFVMEPELALEANLLRFMRLQLSLSYRMVSDVELPGIDNGDASGIGGGVAFLFGDF